MNRRTLLLSTVMLSIGAFSGVVFGDENPFSSNPFKDKPNAESVQLEKERQRSMRAISIRQALLFHKRFVERCMSELPENLSLAYAGALRTDDGRQKRRVADDGATGALTWDVQGDMVVFSCWISTQRTTETIATCRIDGAAIFVNVSFVDDNRAVDQKLPQLGGRSAKDVLVLLERENGEPDAAAKRLGKPVRYALAGFIDVDGDGRSDRALLHKIIKMNDGTMDAEIDAQGVITGKLTAETNYLVMGDVPRVKSADVLRNYSTFIARAARYGIKKMRVDQLLEMGSKK